MDKIKEFFSGASSRSTTEDAAQDTAQSPSTQASVDSPAGQGDLFAKRRGRGARSTSRSPQAAMLVDPGPTVDEQESTTAPEGERIKKKPGRKPKAPPPPPVPEEQSLEQDGEEDAIKADSLVQPENEDSEKPLKTKRGRKPRASFSENLDAQGVPEEPHLGTVNVAEEGLGGKSQRKRAPKQPKDYSDITGEKPMKKRGRPPSKKHRNSDGVADGFDAAVDGALEDVGAVVAEGIDSSQVSPDNAMPEDVPAKKKRGRKSNPDGPGSGKKMRVARLSQPPPASTNGFEDMQTYRPSFYQSKTAEIGALLSYSEAAKLIQGLAQFTNQPRAGVTMAQYLAQTAAPAKMWRRPEDIHRLLVFMACGREDMMAVLPEALDQVPVDLVTLVGGIVGPDGWAVPTEHSLSNIKLAYFAQQVINNGGIKPGVSDNATLERRWSSMTLAEKRHLEMAARGLSAQGL